MTVLSGDLIEDAIHSKGDGFTHESSTAGGASPLVTAGEVKAPDWIFDGRISPFADDRVVLFTAHNEIIEARLGNCSHQGRRSLTFGEIRSPSRPILFSGNLSWISADCVLVAAGTVFGEILVWKCYLGTRERETEAVPAADCEVLFVFSGHEGSIFGVHISPEFQTASGEMVRLLASCSDDRTIRIWDITENNEGSRGYDSHISDARQTGFGDSVQQSVNDDSSTRCLAVTMGHLSRIWQVEFPQEQQLLSSVHTIKIYSFGEDATAQKWHLCFDAEQLQSTPADGSQHGYLKPAAKLTHQLTSANHSGKHIWSHAIHTDQGGHLIATGGSDGKIAFIQNPANTISPERTANNAESPATKSSTDQMISLTLADLSQACPLQHTESKTGDVANDVPSPQKPKNARENFQCYTFITEDRLLVVTNSAKLFAGTFGEELAWTQLALPDAMSRSPFSYCVLGSSKANSLAFIGTTTGDVYYYDGTSDGPSLQLLTKVHGKVSRILTLSDTVNPAERYSQCIPGNLNNGNPKKFPVELLVTVLGSTKAVVIQLDSNLSLSEIEVTLEERFVVTAATFYRDYLLLGSRNGIICVFDQDADGGYSPKSTIKVKFDDAITSIVPLPSRNRQAPGYFLATCRDGKYRIYELYQTSNDTIGLKLLHEVAPRLGSVIEGAWLCENGSGGNDLMLCGFRGKNMVVWNETKQQGIASIECGGGHRSFAYTYLRDKPDGFRFVFTKASQMHVFSQTGASQRTLKPGGHGREIKAASASGRYVATGAEDTAIRIWEYSSNNHTSNNSNPSNSTSPSRPLLEEQNFQCVAVLEKHATGIHTLRWCGDEYLFSSAGSEEFYVWRINRIESDVCPLGVVCEAVFPDRTEGGDLRIMDFDVEQHGPPDSSSSSRGSANASFRISMVLSNSTLQSYTYTRDAGFQLCGRRSYTGACLTQLRHLGAAAVLTAATDGHLAVFGSTASSLPSPTGQNGIKVEEGEHEEEEEEEEEEKEEARDVVVTKLHQNTIKALDVRAVELDGDSAYLVVTGGDDNALGVITVIRSSADTTAPGYEVKAKAIVRSAHAAAVTGVAILRLANDGRDAIVVSASSDQRVKTWRLTGWQQQTTTAGVKGSGGLGVALLDDRYSAVADSGDLEALDGNRFVVVGVGMEVWRVP